MTEAIVVRLTLAHPGFILEADLRLPGRGITALFGPSGAGKTLFLRAIAGLERTARGHIEVNGEIWQDETGMFRPAWRRAVGYVFQEASLFAHLSVRGNLEYALRRSGAEGSVDAVARLLGIDLLLERAPAHLSGGERQRVAIARALLTSPRLLLFDEPLASLDIARRAEILPYLERLHDELSIPSLYVTHMPDEVARLADHLVLLDHGRVVASGPLQDTLARLDLPPAFADSMGVVLETTLVGYDRGDRLAHVTFAGGALLVPQSQAPRSGKLRCRIEARDVSIALARQTGTSILNIIPAVIADAAPLAATAQVLVRLDAGGAPILARITQRSWEALKLAPGQAVWAQIKSVALVG